MPPEGSEPSVNDRLRIAAVVVHFRHWPQLQHTLDSLAAQTPQLDRVVVVDNASGDGSAQAIALSRPDVEVLELADNRGYAAAVNAGVARVAEDTDAVLVVTHECLLAPDTVELLAAALVDDARMGAVAPLLGHLAKPDIVWSAGGGIGRRTGRSYHLGAGSSMAAWSTRSTSPVTWVDGAVWLVRGSVLKELGPLDEWYFLYYEEVDYQQRMRQAGWLVAVVPHAWAWQGPSMMPPYLEARNRLRFLARSRRWLPLCYSLAEQLRLALFASLRPGSRWLARARLTGCLHALSGGLDRSLAQRRP
jgi:GT2 family glycosyltransferase